MTINQGMMAAMAVISAARLSARTPPDSRSASSMGAKALRLVVRCSERKATSTADFSIYGHACFHCSRAKSLVQRR
jgi:hypothetical protein